MVEVEDIEVLRAADRHLLHALSMYWLRSVAFVLTQVVLLAAFSLGFARGSDREPIAIILAFFGLALAVLSALVAVATAQRITLWRSAFIESAIHVDRGGAIDRAEAGRPIASATQVLVAYAT